MMSKKKFCPHCQYPWTPSPEDSEKCIMCFEILDPPESEEKDRPWGRNIARAYAQVGEGAAREERAREERAREEKEREE